MKKATHKGIITHPQRSPYQVLIRETGQFWVETRSGQKYRKTTGTPTGNDPWDARHLKLDSIQEIESTAKEAESNLRKIPLVDKESFFNQVEVVTELKGK